MNKKIDLFFNGDYVCSTMQSKTCRDARLAYLDNATIAKSKLGGISLVQKVILNRPELLKARYAKN